MSTHNGSDPSWQPEAERQIPHKREPQGNHLHLFFIAIIRAPLPGLSASLCDRPHVLSESQGRYVAGSMSKCTVRCTDKENRLATMHHRDTDICVSLLVLCRVGIYRESVTEMQSILIIILTCFAKFLCQRIKRHEIILICIIKGWYTT